MSDAAAQQITIQPVLPAEPIVLCNPAFLHTLAVVEREVAHIAIADSQSAQAAANLAVRLTSAAKALESERERLKAPFLAKGREIDAAARAPALRIEQAKSGVAKKLLAFHQEQERIAREAEAARRAELERLERIRIEEERVERERVAEVARIAAEQAKAVAADLTFDDDVPPPAPEPPAQTETEKRIDAVRYAPAPVAEKPAGIRYTTRLIIDTIDVSKLPDAFVTRTAKEAAIRQTFCVQWKEGEPMPECPGCTFRVDRQVASTGRAVF